MGMLGMHGTVTSAKAISECDLFIGIGTRFSDRVIGDVKSFAPKAKILHIDIDPAEVNKNIKVSNRVLGDIKVVISKLNSLISQKQNKEWMDCVRTWKKQYPLHQEAPRGGDNPRGGDIPV